MRPMDTAPKDGSRILIKTVTYGYNHLNNRMEPTGDQWIEGRWAANSVGQHEWLQWTGDPKIFTTNTLRPLGWSERPSDEMESV
ncbi:hypothetical protein [Hyphomicrobium sp.]|uniref:hypothetical protein n=1 Tax=Hyphomicrobium sp. TaxID=82 RepID=UPI001DA0A4AD|nr:hypothetical protein [Hyphomicrobium sp.]MBY0559844.1 hypothetical protein [Hyphomicrobium sp.]